MGELIEIKKYSPEYKNAWDNFVDSSKNGSFHLKRDFVEYHSDRFTDHSLLVFEKNVLKALIPANIKDNVLYSHQGLTYGGIVVEETIYLTVYIELVKNILVYLQQQGIEKFIIKEIPWTYSNVFNDDFNYVMNLVSAKVVRFDVLPHVDIKKPIEYQTRRKRSINKASGLNFKTVETQELDKYWELLKSVLEKHDAKPVHSLEEIKVLKNNFPNNVHLFEIHEAEISIAGVLIFETKNVVRAQYIASSERGKETGALDLLFHELITRIYSEKKYFDFGTTTLNGGYTLSFGLSDQKEGFGARTVVQHSYEIDTKNLDLTKIDQLKA